MTTTVAHRVAGSLDTLIHDGLRALDITATERERVVSRYTQLGEALDEHWIATRGDNSISPQGSFALGTVVRNVHRSDDIDIDCVALKDVAKASVGQAELKADVGIAARKYARSACSGGPELSQCSRCWTLSWPGMHLDILPAIPNDDAGGSNIWITDREVSRWLPSNPGGYADWFRGRMHAQLLHERAVEAKRLEVEDVPEWQVRTVLQRVVQALKRHRDIYFSDRLDERPSSIVITTLAAHAYTGSGDLYEVLRNLPAEMARHLTRVQGRWTLPNPVQDGENFTDSWASEPERAEYFFEWVEEAERTFRSFGMSKGLERTLPLLESAFGSRFATAASASLGQSLFGARQRGQLYVGNRGTLSAATGGVAAGSYSVKGHRFGGGPTR
ncbi:nucleotidyltransferase [Micromonospora sp. NPDC049891]|uniref:nucleotidyltransferase domain-containing protein n=1 Tax=Micromonospora sp. NPDC049891 TaxID=3155655 RepID=UPI0033E0B84A